MTRTIASRRQNTSAGRFVGRFAEQQLFRATLRQLAALRNRHDEQLTDDELTYAQIFLIAAEGGMGKTTLLRRFEAIIAENSEGSDAQALYLDWERYAPISDSDKLMRVLHDALCQAGFKGEMQPYRDTITKRDVAQKKAADAEEKYKSLAGFSSNAAQTTSDGSLTPDVAVEGIHASVHGLADLRAFIRKKLDPDEWKLYDDPDAVTEMFMEALNSVATRERPLVLLLDTYELADRFDSWLRKRALPQSNPRLIWALAGREGQPFIRRYEDEFGTTLIGRILLDTFARPDIVAYLQQCGIVAPDDQLIDHLQALSRGIPLVLEGWFNLYLKNFELPPFDPVAPTTRREIVRAMTDRFLRYCEDDKGLTPAERRQREATRNHILALMLLRQTDAAVLAAAWQCSDEQAEATLNDMSDQFSFVFAQEIEREPHALVKEFLRAHLREMPNLPTAMQIAVARLVTYFETRLRERERKLWGTDVPPPPVLNDEQIRSLQAQREAHQRRLRKIEIQIAGYGALAAPTYLLTQREDAEHSITEIDTKLNATASNDLIDEGLRRPLWKDETWRETLLDLVNTLCWADRSGEQVMRVFVPMFVEALEFEQKLTISLLNIAEETVQIWLADHSTLFARLLCGRNGMRWVPNPEQQLMVTEVLQSVADRWRLTTVQRAILHLHHGSILATMIEKMSQACELALACADKATALLSDDGGELAERLAGLYRSVGQAYLWPKVSKDAFVSVEAAPILAIATRLSPTDHNAWYASGIAYFKLQKYQDSITALQQAITHNPIDAYPHNGLGNVYRALKRYDEALEAYQYAIQLDPTYAYPHNGLGNVYYKLKRYDKALEAYQYAIQLDPTYAYPHNGLGNVYYNLKRYDEAIVSYQHAMRIDPTFAYPHAGLGNIYSLQDRIEAARGLYQQAIKLDATSYRALIALARIERKGENQSQAAVLINQARSLMPNDELYNLACLESIASNVDAAIEALRMALEHKEVDVKWVRDDLDLIFIRDDPRYRALVGLADDDTGAG